jgi:hypothetical protein
MERVYLFINGIETDDFIQAWTSMGARWVQLRTRHRAEAISYTALALFRSFDLRGLFFPSFYTLFPQRHRAIEIAAVIEYYRKEGNEVVVVAHSNGVELACRAFKLTKESILAFHAFAGATAADFTKNGLNDALLSSKLGNVFLYCSHSDRALEIAKFSRFLTFGFAGYGDLGRVGPQHIHPKIDSQVVTRWFPGFGHSTYFTPTNFEKSMRYVAWDVAVDAGQKL